MEKRRSSLKTGVMSHEDLQKYLEKKQTPIHFDLETIKESDKEDTKPEVEKFIEKRRQSLKNEYLLAMELNKKQKVDEEDDEDDKDDKDVKQNTEFNQNIEHDHSDDDSEKSH